MAVKPCRLAILKRYPDPEHVDLFQDPAPAQYYDQINDNWVTYKSNATLFNKTDLKRDFLEDVAMFQKHQIKLEDGQIVPTVLEMEELITKKPYGFLIRRHLPATEVEGGGELTQWLGQFLPEAEGPVNRWMFFNSPFNSQLLDIEEKDVLLTKLKAEFPDQKFSVKELYEEG